MENIAFFKQQAKNFFRDYKTRVYNEKEGFYDYSPRFFENIEEILYDFDVKDDDSFTLMNAQHIISKLAGFNKWNDLIKSSEPMLEVGKYLLENNETDILSEWKSYEKGLNQLDDSTKLEIFKKIFVDETCKNVNYSIDFTDDENAQDMIVKVMKEKNVSPAKAITGSIKSDNFIDIIEEGYASIALPLWGHADQYSEKEKLDNPVITFKLTPHKEKMIKAVIKEEDVQFKEAVLYFVLFELSHLGYHI